MVESFQDATGNGGMLQIGMGDNGLQHARSDEGEPQPRSVCQWSTTVRVPANKAIFISADNFNIPKTTTGKLNYIQFLIDDTHISSCLNSSPSQAEKQRV